MSRARVGVLLSGRGSNLRALLEAARSADYPAEIVLVVSNNPDAPGLEIARAAGVAAYAIDHRPFRGDRAAHERALDEALRGAGVELVALAGYMRVFTSLFVGAWAGRMINIHPSLLPRFPGLHTHAAALASGDGVHGCTVHWVTEGVDAGPILDQSRVPILPGDDVETLAARVLDAEHRLYPQALAKAVEVLRGRSGRAACGFAPDQPASAP